VGRGSPADHGNNPLPAPLSIRTEDPSYAEPMAVTPQRKREPLLIKYPISKTVRHGSSGQLWFTCGAPRLQPTPTFLRPPERASRGQEQPWLPKAGSAVVSCGGG
jgi:hypothetical protein